MVEKFDSNEIEDSAECIDMPLELREKVEELEKISEKELEIRIRMEKEINQVKERYFDEIALLRRETVEPIKAIPEFWSVVIQSCCPDEVFDYDIPALKSLREVRSFLIKEGHPLPRYPQCKKDGLLIEFVFDSNSYFENDTLFKYYELSFDVKMDEYLMDITCTALRIDSSEIDWKEGKDLTIDFKSPMLLNDRGDAGLDPNELAQPSFFSFFDKPDDEFYINGGDELITLLAHDLRFGLLIHDHLIPKAVHYFTGRAQPPDADLFDDMDSMDDDSLSQNSSDNDYSGNSSGPNTSGTNDGADTKNHHYFADKGSNLPSQKDKCNQQ